MILNTSQIKLFIDALSYLIKCKEYEMNVIADVQDAVIHGYNQLAREESDPEEQHILWAEADKEEDLLDRKLEKHQYRNYYHKRFLQYLQNELRKCKKGGVHAITA